MILAVLLLINDAKYYTSNDNQLEETGNPEFLFDSNIINLGLDLKGGTVYQLSPEIDKWILEKLQDDNIDKIIKDIPNNIRTVVITGGEPLMWDLNLLTNGETTPNAEISIRFHQNHNKKSKIKAEIDSLFKEL